jgi:hypothetical protein
MRVCPKTDETGALLMPSLLVLVSLIPGSCSSKQSQLNVNKTPTSSPRSEKASFDVRGGRRIEQVIIKKGTTSQTIDPKGDLGFVAVEIRLLEENKQKPVPANFSDVTLVDSAGVRYKPLFIYPSALSKCEHDCEAISFIDDSSRLIGGKLSELGGVLVVVFNAPRNTGEFKVEVADSLPVEIKVGVER